MNLKTEKYLEGRNAWPDEGEHILAQYDDDTIVVYQAYRPEIAEWAVSHQQFGGPWSFNRMSWLKPNFLWMMYRCGWATKSGQERVLAIRIQQSGFEQILSEAVATSFRASNFDKEADWRAQMDQSDVRLQWDPDHDPTGSAVARRAIQLGLKAETLRKFATEWITEIEDITGFVDRQRQYADRPHWEHLEVPRERVFERSSKASG